MKILNQKRNFWILAPIAAIAIFFASCYPNNGTVYNSSLDTVMTLFDDSLAASVVHTVFLLVVDVVVPVSAASFLG